MNLHAPYYQTVADYGDLGPGNACDPATYEDACDALAQCMTEGRDAVVFRCDPPTGDAAGMMTDVTEDAAATVRGWENRRGAA
jgi:hypothetical protein